MRSKPTTTAFGQTLLAPKIYSARNVYLRFSALIASARTQPTKEASRLPTLWLATATRSGLEVFHYSSAANG